MRTQIFFIFYKEDEIKKRKVEHLKSKKKKTINLIGRHLDFLFSN